MKWYLAVLKQYATFSGRASRSEYWFFVLFSIIASLVLTVIDVVIGKIINIEAFVGLSALYTLAVLIPSIAVGIRRMHDQGKSGFYLLLSFVPCVGGLILLYFLVQPSTPGDNEYGAEPGSDPA